MSRSLNKDQGLGALILFVSIVVIFLYAYLIIFYPLIVLQITAFIAVAAILIILAWIGYTLMTTPAPKPTEEINNVKEPESKDASQESKQ